MAGLARDAKLLNSFAVQDAALGHIAELEKISDMFRAAERLAEALRAGDANFSLRARPNVRRDHELG